MTRRLRQIAALGLAGALAATACASSGGRADPLVKSPPTTDAPTCTVKIPPTTKGTITVTVAESFDARSQQAASLLVGQFNAMQSRINVVLQPRSSDASVEQQLTAPGGSRKAPTLVVLDDIRTQAVADSQKILPASLCFKASHVDLSSFMPSARAYYTVDDDLLAASANLTAPILYFDRTAFRAAGLDPAKPPTTLDQIYVDAVKLKQANPTSLPLAMKMSSWLVESWLTGAGNAIVNNDNGRSNPADRSTFDSKNAVAVHEWLQKMYAADLIDLVPDTPDQHAHEAALATRRSSMLIESSTAIGDIDALEAGTLDPTLWGFPATTAAAPTRPAARHRRRAAAGTERGRPRSGERQRLVPRRPSTSPAAQAAAWTFLTWWNEPAQQVAWSLEGSYLPYNSKAVSDPDLQSVWQHTRRGRWLDTAYTEITDFDTQNPGPLIGPYSAVRAAIVESMTRGHPWEHGPGHHGERDRQHDRLRPHRVPARPRLSQHARALDAGSTGRQSSPSPVRRPVDTDSSSEAPCEPTTRPRTPLLPAVRMLLLLAVGCRPRRARPARTGQPAPGRPRPSWSTGPASRPPCSGGPAGTAATTWAGSAPAGASTTGCGRPTPPSATGPPIRPISAPPPRRRWRGR